MSTYSHLPIYTSIFFLLKYLYEKVPRFSKQYKYLLGEKMLDCCIGSIVLIGRISEERDEVRRIEHVEEIDARMQVLLSHARIAHELHQLGNKESYFFLSEKIVDVLSQTESWKKFLRKKELSRNHASRGA